MQHIERHDNIELLLSHIVLGGRLVDIVQTVRNQPFGVTKSLARLVQKTTCDVRIYVSRLPLFQYREKLCRQATCACTDLHNSKWIRHPSVIRENSYDFRYNCVLVGKDRVGIV